MHDPASAVVLAGGQSRRLGRDKRTLRLWGPDGPMLLEAVVAQVSLLCDDVVVVLNDAPAWSTLPARLVPDAYADGGALGGIYAGLSAMRHPVALVVACDMPSLSIPLLRAMLALPRSYDVLVPRTLHAGTARNAAGLEPLHALYTHTCLAPMRALLDAGERQIVRLFAAVHTRILEPEVVRQYDPQGRSFFNINTPEQLDQATGA